MIYLKLFWSFFQIGLFSVGGGYAAMPLIQHQVVELNNWLTMQEFVDIITISQRLLVRLRLTRPPSLASRLPDCLVQSSQHWDVSFLPVSSF